MTAAPMSAVPMNGALMNGVRKKLLSTMSAELRVNAARRNDATKHPPDARAPDAKDLIGAAKTNAAL